MPDPHAVIARVAAHDFHPLNDDGSMTHDRALGQAGIADLADLDWRVRTLAVRDLVRWGSQTPPAGSGVAGVIDGLGHADPQVRYIAATALGILGAQAATEPLLARLREDEVTFARAQAALALGQIGAASALPGLRGCVAGEAQRDVMHQCELAVAQIEKQMPATAALRRAWLDLDEATFGSVAAGASAPDFTLEDTAGQLWALSGHRGRWVVLVWIFADWCPVCHGEFRELIELRDDFAGAGIEVATLEAHDTFRGRVMVGRELEPTYWFAKESFQQAYVDGIWWPHLLDRAGAVAARYGAAPTAFAVHAEYINRPAVVIADPQGIVRFAYHGTFWGDRPSMHAVLHMIQQEQFDFEHEHRLHSGEGQE